MASFNLLIAGLMGLASIALGAIGAHMLDPADTQALRWLDTGLNDAGWHVATLVALGLYMRSARMPEGWANIASVAFCAGLVLFSGSLYAMAFGAPAAISVATPIGGVAFMLGWLIIILWALLGRRS